MVIGVDPVPNPPADEPHIGVAGHSSRIVTVWDQSVGSAYMGPTEGRVDAGSRDTVKPVAPRVGSVRATLPPSEWRQ